MKKKWIALKRRWKKLHRMDRRFFRLIGAFMLFYLALTFLWISFLPNLVWMTTLMMLQYFNICIRRNRQYAYYLRGCVHQLTVDWVRDRRTVNENVELKVKNRRLHSDYKKLEYDYNQLKKSINPKKKKK